MIRYCCLLLLCCITSFSLAQETMSPAAAQRVLRIIERAEGNTEQILEELREFSEGRSIRNSDRGFVIRERAALLVREDRMDEARDLLAITLQGQEADYVPPLRLLYGQLLLMEGESAQALDQLEQWSAQVENPYPPELSILAYAYLQEEHWGEAASVFERVMELSEADNDQWFEMLAYAYAQDGETDKAVALLESIITERPWEARWWRQLSGIYLLLENYSSGAAGLAIADYAEELNFEESRRLSGLLSMIKMPAEGAGVLEQAFERYPEARNFEDQMLLGELWMLSREHDKAIETFQLAADSAEADGEPALKIAQLHLQWERYEEAQEALVLAQQAYGEDTPESIFYLLAIAEINLGNLDAASEAINRLEEDGEFGERAENLSLFVQNLRNNP